MLGPINPPSSLRQHVTFYASQMLDRAVHLSAWGSIVAQEPCIHTSLLSLLKEVQQTTPRGFEPLRPEANGFRVHLLSHSDTVSCHREAYGTLNLTCAIDVNVMHGTEALRRASQDLG